MIGRASQALELDSSGVLAVAVNVCEAGTVHPAVATATVQACLTACGARAQASAPMCPDEDGESKRYFSFGRFYSDTAPPHEKANCVCGSVGAKGGDLLLLYSTDIHYVGKGMQLASCAPPL